MTLPRLPALFGAALLCLLPSLVRADGPAHGLLDRTFTDADGKEAKYALFVPHDYNGDKAYPLVLFLHGAGETGNDGKQQTYVGLGPVARMNEKNFPFFILFPQSHDRTWQADSKDAQRALDMLAAVQKEYKIDDKRLLFNRPVDGRLRDVEPGREVPRPLGRHRAGLRRRRPRPGEGHQGHSLLGLPGRRRHGRPRQRSRAHGRRPQGRRRRAEVRRIRRRRT